MDNVLNEIGDILTVNVTPQINGKVTFSGYELEMDGLTDTRTVSMEYRISDTGIFWTSWDTLTAESLAADTYTADGQLTIQLRFTRTGSDETGTITFNNIRFYGNVETVVFDAPTLSSSIFADLIGTDELRQLTENLFKKLYYRGILPQYITRAENDSETEDADFIDVFFPVAKYFALMIRFFSRFEDFWNDYDLMLENVRSWGIYFDESNVTLEDLQYLSGHILDEARKRGTAMIFVRKGDTVNGVEQRIDGEFIRLIRSTVSDELIYEEIPLHKIGWCLGQMSPMYRGTAGAYRLNKTQEDTPDFQDLSLYTITQSTTAGLYALQTFDSRSVLRLYRSSSGTTTTVGLGRVSTSTEVSTDDMIVIDPNIDYEITFAFYINSGSSSSNRLIFGVEGFNKLGNRLVDAFVTPNGNTTSEEFVNESLNCWKTGNWYFARGIMHAYSTMNYSGVTTNLGYGTDLHFNNSFTKYILPKIQVQGTTAFDVKIWNYKVRPLVRGSNILPLKNGTENSHSLGFLECGRIFYLYAKNNNNSQSEDEVREIIERYLLAYGTTNMFVFINKS